MCYPLPFQDQCSELVVEDLVNLFLSEKLRGVLRALPLDASDEGAQVIVRTFQQIIVYKVYIALVAVDDRLLQVLNVDFLDESADHKGIQQGLTSFRDQVNVKPLQCPVSENTNLVADNWVIQVVRVDQSLNCIHMLLLSLGNVGKDPVVICAKECQVDITSQLLFFPHEENVGLFATIKHFDTIRCRFSRCRFSRCRFSRCRFSRCRFSRCRCSTSCLALLSAKILVFTAGSEPSREEKGDEYERELHSLFFDSFFGFEFVRFRFCETENGKWKMMRSLFVWPTETWFGLRLLYCSYGSPTRFRRRSLFTHILFLLSFRLSALYRMAFCCSD